jgi:hypothetical protein
MEKTFWQKVGWKWRKMEKSGEEWSNASGGYCFFNKFISFKICASKIVGNRRKSEEIRSKTD